MAFSFKISALFPFRPRRFTGLALAIGALLGAGLLGLACDSAPGGYDPCVGGVIINGVCEGKCIPDRCKDQNTCVGNRCLLVCAGHDECYHDGSQSCAPAKEDDTGKDILVCQSGGKPAGMGASCVEGTECAAFLACPDGAGCKADQCGGDTSACALDEAACKGAAGCTIGKCPNGDVCRVDCLKECGPWLECQALAEGDADAYCTERDCAADGDCLAGFYCGVVRSPYDICGPTCVDSGGGELRCAGGNHDGELCPDDKFCEKGNDSLCGKTKEPCKEADKAGATFFEGSVCLLRRSCLERGPGSPCATDLDCSRISGQRCVKLGGESRCAAGCAADSDCLSDSRCDAEQAACLPRFGAWVGAGKFCEPCVSDEDCGSIGTAVACALMPGGGRGCFDYSYPDTCAADADCPLSPGGLHGNCLDELDSVNPGDTLYHRCSLPLDAMTMNPTCW